MGKLTSELAEYRIFEGLDEQYLELIAKAASDVTFSEGEYIFREGEVADNFYIIKRGTIAIEVVMAAGRDPIIIQNIEDGEILGWSWLIPPHKMRFDARATMRTDAVAFDGKFLREKCESDSELGYELMKRFAQVVARRVHAVRLQNPDMYLVRPSEDQK